MSVQKIIIVGEKSVGKQSFRDKLMSLHNKNADPDSLSTTRFLPWTIDHHLLKIEFKIVEPDEMPAVRDTFYRTANGFLLMFSLDNQESLKTVEKMREQIFAVRSQSKIILVGNKCDQNKKLRQVKKSDAKRLAKKWKAEYFETSVTESKNLDDCLDILLRAIVEKKHTCKVRERVTLKATLDRFKYYNCFQ